MSSSKYSLYDEDESNEEYDTDEYTDNEYEDEQLSFGLINIIYKSQNNAGDEAKQNNEENKGKINKVEVSELPVSNNTKHEKINITEKSELLECRNINYEKIKLPYLKPLDIEDDVIFVKSPMGTGKTTICGKFITDIIDKNPNYKVSILSVRQSFTYNVKENLIRTTGLNFKSYLDIKEDETPQFYITQIESIYKDNNEREIIIIDEIESVRRQIHSGLDKGRNELNKMLFKEHIKNAKKLVILDADLTRLSVEFIRGLREKDEKYKIIHNDIKNREGYKVLHHQTENSFIDEIVKSRAKGENVCVVTNNYSELKAIKAIGKIDLGNSEFFANQENDNKDILKRINEHIVEKNINTLLYTPTLQVGVDITVPFDRIFVFADAMSNTARELHQQIGRIRNLNSKLINVYVKNANYNYPTSAIEIRKEIRENIRIKNNAIRDITNKLKYDVELINGKYIYNISNDIFTTNIINNQVDVNLSKNNMKKELDKKFVEQGYEIIDYEENDNLYNYMEDVKKAKKNIKMEKIEKIKNTEPKTEAETMELKNKINKGEATAKDKIDHKLSTLMSKFNESIFTGENKDTYKILLEGKLTRNRIFNTIRETMPITDIVENDFNKDHLINNSNMLMVKLLIIKRLCKILGIDNTLSKNDIQYDKLHSNEFMEYIDDNFYDIKKTFALQKVTVPTTADINERINVLRSILRVWNNTSIRLKNKNIKKGPYILSNNMTGLDVFVNNYKYNEFSTMNYDKNIEGFPINMKVKDIEKMKTKEEYDKMINENVVYVNNFLKNHSFNQVEYEKMMDDMIEEYKQKGQSVY